ncbi:hypothetical protein NA57DRAFT_77412 [Rhizodiscina lignyota]|uniref:Uncharacterized protein n=1 Tax=Rhizodiscina lignyota TaxID=1504668 RepID=A0A9P4IBU7_9PEZI|nr:hypothetical protein NA57DRAFT_77412 [Rhizodiscina lignyota]
MDTATSTITTLTTSSSTFDTVTTISTSTETTTTDLTSTIPAASGFLPIQSTLPGAAANKRRELEVRSSPNPAHGLAGILSRKWGGDVTCRVFCGNCATTTHTKTVTKTASPKTSTAFSTSTILVMSVPVADTTVSVTSTSTITASVTPTDTQVTTSTSTVYTSTTSSYAACATDNFASTVNGQAIVNGEDDEGTTGWLQYSAGDAYDCCVAAILGGADFFAWSGSACLIDSRSTCAAPVGGVDQSDQGIVTVADTSSEFTISNAYCGQWSVVEQD